MPDERSQNGPQSERVRYALDAQVLARLGHELMSQKTPGVFTLSGEVAQSAIAAWERDEEGVTDGETDAERRTRHAAATLALIGLGLSERGTRLADGTYAVRLDSADAEEAIRAAREGSN